MPRRGENIYKRKDGRWEGRIKISTNGKNKYKSVYGKTYNAVKVKILNFRAEITNPKNENDKTIDSLFDEWFGSIKYTVKTSTFYNYKMKAEKHIIPEFGKYKYTALEPSMINSFVSRKISSGLSPGYVCDIIAVFNAMSRHVSKIYGLKNIIAETTVPRVKSKELALLSDEQQKVLCKNLMNKVTGTSLCILLSLFTGLRIGEVCCLTWSDINFINNTITINKTVQRVYNPDTSSTHLSIDEPKSKSSKRIIPIPSFLLEILKNHQSDENDYILSGDTRTTEPRTLQRRFKTILKNSGLPDIHYHSLRHMFATNCLQLGFDIKTLSEILGHSSVEITLKLYVHSSLERKIECMNLLNPAV